MEGILVGRVAEELGVARQQVHRWIASGSVSSFVDSSGRHVVPAHEVAYLVGFVEVDRMGRPPSQRRVWEELMLVESKRIDRDRLTSRRWFSHRSIRLAGWSQDFALQQLRQADECMLGGIDAAAHASGGGVARLGRSWRPSCAGGLAEDLQR